MSLVNVTFWTSHILHSENVKLYLEKMQAVTKSRAEPETSDIIITPLHYRKQEHCSISILNWEINK